MAQPVLKALLWLIRKPNLVWPFWGYCVVCVQSLSRVWLLAAPWNVAHRVPLSVGFSRQEHWSGVPFPPPGHLPNPGIEPESPHCRWILYTTEPLRKPSFTVTIGIFLNSRKASKMFLSFNCWLKRKCTTWELWAQFYLQQNEDFSLGDSTSDSSESCSTEAWGKVSIDVTLVKGEYMQSSTYFPEGFYQSREVFPSHKQQCHHEGF